MPTAIGELATGDTALVDAFAPALLDTGGFDWGQYSATLCSDEAVADIADEIARSIEGTDLMLTRGLHELNGGYALELCEIWQVELSPVLATDPVESDLPALVLTGNFDPATPPSYGERAASHLSNGQYVLFNGIGHGVLRSDTSNPSGLSCAQQIVTTFPDEPGGTVDATCAAELPGPYD